MLMRCGLLVMGMVCLLGNAAAAQSACKMVRVEHYECDRVAFAKTLAEAHTIRVEAGRMDAFAADRAGQLVTKLGKRVAGPDQHAELSFQVAAVDRNGRIDFGPEDIPLARLNVYDAEHRLVWVETLDGQAEIPWSADVIELLKRFQADIAGSKG